MLQTHARYLFGCRVNNSNERNSYQCLVADIQKSLITQRFFAPYMLLLIFLSSARVNYCNIYTDVNETGRSFIKKKSL